MNTKIRKLLLKVTGELLSVRLDQLGEFYFHGLLLLSVLQLEFS